VVIIIYIYVLSVEKSHRMRVRKSGKMKYNRHITMCNNSYQMRKKINKSVITGFIRGYLIGTCTGTPHAGLITGTVMAVVSPVVTIIDHY
jgi:hypothetical protein